MRLSKREIVLLYVLVITLIVFLCVTFMINPVIKQLNEVKSTISDLESDLKSKKYSYNQDKDILELIKKEGELLEENKKKLKRLVSDLTLNTEVRNFFAKHGAELKTYTSSGETDVEINKQIIKDICFVSISVEIIKNYANSENAHSDIKNIIIALKEAFKSVILNRASYNVTETDTSGFEVNANINFSIYMSR